MQVPNSYQQTFSETIVCLEKIEDNCLSTISIIKKILPKNTGQKREKMVYEGA